MPFKFNNEKLHIFKRSEKVEKCDKDIEEIPPPDSCTASRTTF